MSNEREQKLVDICFAVGLMIHYHDSFEGKTQEEVAEWITKQLRDSGFPTVPCGASWGVLNTSCHENLNPCSEVSLGPRKTCALHKKSKKRKGLKA